MNVVSVWEGEVGKSAVELKLRKGMSASGIAKEVNKTFVDLMDKAVTRNSVIGYLWRQAKLNAELRACLERGGANNGKRRFKRPDKAFGLDIPKQYALGSEAKSGLKAVSKMAQLPNDVEPMLAGEAIDAHRKGQCKYIHGDPIHLMAYCAGVALSGKSYCQEHQGSGTRGKEV